LAFLVYLPLLLFFALLVRLPLLLFALMFGLAFALLSLLATLRVFLLLLLLLLLRTTLLLLLGVRVLWRRIRAQRSTVERRHGNGCHQSIHTSSIHMFLPQRTHEARTSETRLRCDSWRLRCSDGFVWKIGRDLAMQ
jgi:hypothetical protein